MQLLLLLLMVFEPLCCCLNSGFHKIDTDKWEFANEGFLRGQQHLLRTIQRRKSAQSGSSSTGSGAKGGDEIERLRKERSSMVQEVVELQQQQCGMMQRLQAANKEIQMAERRQKQMVSFLGKVLQNPSFLARLKERKEEKGIAHVHEPGTSDQTTGKRIHGMGQEYLSSQETTNPFPILDAQELSTPDAYIWFPLQPKQDKNISVSETGEGICGIGGSSTPSFDTELWSNVGHYSVPESGAMPDVWDVDYVETTGSLGGMHEFGWSGDSSTKRDP